jgi:hypothetical protein
VAASLVAGAVLAAVADLPARVAATVTAFGGGTLLAAVALQLVPAADRSAGPWLTGAGLLAGTLVYVVLGGTLLVHASPRSSARRRRCRPARCSRWSRSRSSRTASPR